MKILLAAIVLCIAFSSCHATRTGPGRPYRQYTKYHVYQQHHKAGNHHNDLAQR